MGKNIYVPGIQDDRCLPQAGAPGRIQTDGQRIFQYDADVPEIFRSGPLLGALRMETWGNVTDVFSRF